MNGSDYNIQVIYNSDTYDIIDPRYARMSLGIVSSASGNTEIKVKNSSIEDGNISPKLFFSFIKSKFTKLQKEKLKNKISKLVYLVEYSRKTGQLALFEESAKKVIEVSREQEATILGINYYLKKEVIDKYIYKVKDKVIKFKEWSEFPRVAPKEVTEKLIECKEHKIFDEYWVLYTDYTKPSEELKSTKNKIVEKDPVLFGKFKSNPNNFYYIAEWIDEHCDITFEKLINEIGKIDPSFKIPMIETIDDDFIENLKEELRVKEEKLRNTNRSNFNELASSEESSKNKIEEIKKNKFVKKLKNLFTFKNK